MKYSTKCSMKYNTKCNTIYNMKCNTKEKDPCKTKVCKLQLGGLEPPPALCGHEPESCAYANSATTAQCLTSITQIRKPVNYFFKEFFWISPGNFWGNFYAF